MIVVNLRFSAVSTVALFTSVFTDLAYDALAPCTKKKIITSCNLFLLCFVRFKCYCFCSQGIKTKPYSANKAKPHFTDFFLSYNSQVYFKIASCVLCLDLSTSLLLCSSRLFASIILLRKFTLILPERHYLFHENKS